MVIRTSSVNKHSPALTSVIPVVLPGIVFCGLNLIMDNPTPLWMLLLTLVATALGLWMWFQRGFILSLRVSASEVEIVHLLGREVLPLEFAQALCRIKILGLEDYALVTKNGNVLPLNLGGFWDRKGLLQALEHCIHDHNAKSKLKIDLPS